MPYKKKYVPKRKKSYRRRFKDDKINTKIERKINQISKKNDAKNRQLLVRATSYGTNITQYQPGQYGFASLPANAAGGDQPYTGLSILNLTAIGGANQNTVNPKGPTTSTYNTTNRIFRATKIQAFLRFLNPSDYPMTVRVSLIWIPNANYYTASDDAQSTNTTINLKPNQYICGVKELRNIGIFREGFLNAGKVISSTEGPANIKHTILASKQITLQPPICGSGVNSTYTVPNNQTHHFGYNNTAYRERNISISKTFKGLGKKLLYVRGTGNNQAQEEMANGNIYLVITHNAEQTQAQPMVKGMAGIQYYIDRPATISYN